MYLTGLHLRVPGGAPATYARDMRLFGAFPTESALPLRTAHVISAISSPGPFLLLARKLYVFRPRQPESAVRGVPQPSSQPDAWKMCIVQESSDGRKSPSPEVLVAQSGSLAWCLPCSIQGTVPVPPARYLGHGCLHSWGSWSVVQAFACRSWIVDRGSWIVDRTKKCGQIRSIGYIVFPRKQTNISLCGWPVG
jgi:hypothetical protein